MSIRSYFSLRFSLNIVHGRTSRSMTRVIRHLLFWLCNPDNIEFQWRRGNGGNGFCCGTLSADFDPRFAILALHCGARLSPNAKYCCPHFVKRRSDSQFTRSLSPAAIFCSVRSISGIVQQDISGRIEFSANAPRSAASIFLYIFRNSIPDSWLTRVVVLMPPKKRDCANDGYTEQKKICDIVTI